MEPGRLGRVRARIDRVACKKLHHEKNAKVHACPGTLCGFCLSPETHPAAAGVLRASLRLDRDSDGSSVDVRQGFPPLGCRDASSSVLWLQEGAGQRASHNHETEHQKNKPPESPLATSIQSFPVLTLPFPITFQQHSLSF